MKKLLLAIVAIISLASCTRDLYITSSYYELAPNHEILAILPVETITFGRIPEEITEEQLEMIEEGESKAFQISLYGELTKRSGPFDGDIRVNFQHYSQTNKLLEDAGISLRDSWLASPAELCEILGVDAVVRTTVEKERLLTDLESFGISLGAALLRIYSNSLYPWWITPSPRTSNVKATAAVLDAENGIPVWTTEEDCPTYWNRRHREVIENITRRLCRRFPYRG